MPDIQRDLSSLSVLSVFGHPDDEGFGSGGTLAMLADLGASITMVCATNGDVGEISDASLATPENLAQVRQEELRQAALVTGVTDVRFLGYRDSGMAGTEDNNHPNSLYQAPPDQVVSLLVAIIREVRPDMIITHDPTGAYGHPDHMTTYAHVTQAFALAGDGAAHPPQPGSADQPWTPRLLYYVCFPRSVMQRMWQEMRDAGVTPPFASLEDESLGSPDEEVTTVVNVAAYVDTKMASLACHRTQMDPNGPFAQLPEEASRQIMSTEYFTLAVRQGVENEDLLANLAEL